MGYHGQTSQGFGSRYKRRQKDFRRQRWWVTPRRQQIDTHSNHRDCDSMHKPAEVQTRQQSQHREGKVDPMSQPQPGSYFQWIPIEKGKICFLRWNALGVSSIYQGRTYTQRQLASIKGLHALFVCAFFFFCFGIFLVLVSQFVVIFVFGFIFIFEGVMKLSGQRDGEDLEGVQ